jgi:hypothetical protein
VTFVSVLLVLVGALGALVFALAIWGAGSRSDLLDWDPRERVRTRRNADLDELARGLDEHNQRRIDAGLSPQTEDELRRELARHRRRAEP